MITVKVENIIEKPNTIILSCYIIAVCFNGGLEKNMIFDNPIELYTTTIKQGEEYLLGIMNELNLLDNDAFDNMEYIYEIYYRDGIKVINRSVKNHPVSNSIFSNMLKININSIEKINDVEVYLKSMKGLPIRFMQDEAFSINLNRAHKELEIIISEPEKVDFNNIENLINRSNIADIKFLYNNNVYNVHFDKSGIIELSMSVLRLDDIYNQQYEILNVSGLYRNNKFKIDHITLRVDKEGFLDIINGYGSNIIMSYHIININEKHKIGEIIDNGEKVDRAICLINYDGEIVIDDDNFNYGHYVYMENNDFYVNDEELDNEIDESDPDYLFGKMLIT